MSTIIGPRPRLSTQPTESQSPHTSPASSPSSNNRQSSKTSLDFICSPSSATSSSSVPPPSTIMSISLAPTSSGTPSSLPSDHFLAQVVPKQSTDIALDPKYSKSRLSNLPRDVLSAIAFHLVADNRGIAGHPSPLIPFFLTSRAIYEAISFDNNPRLYNRLFRATFDVRALDRRYDWMVKHLATTAGRGRKIFDLFSDPRSWAIDYKTRWEQSWRMRQVAKAGKLEIPNICDKDQIAADLWNVWFVLTENDGRNLAFLAQQCHFQQWMAVWYREDMLKDSLVPGYPKETGEKALGIWCSLLSGTDLSAEQTAEEVDEKIFVMRPFIFACAKYDITYAPWHHRRLPICPPSCKDHETDVTLRSKALPYKRFGYTWRRAPPHFIPGCYLVFLRLLERQPDRIGLAPGSSTFSLLPGSSPQPGLFSITRILPSIYHDREWQRNSVCQDPHTSPGLPPLTFRGEVEGFWRANFLFYDFDMYRQILAGNMRAVYTGTFGEQVAEMDLKETVVRVKIQDVGGKGPMLSAGFREVAEGEVELEQQRIVEGYGCEIVLNEDEKDQEGWTKEILISGRMRSSWGCGFVRGRVRAWDGLVILHIAYPQHGLGKWLWRGYLHTGGHLVGRWRDTFTAENLRGYEGAFGMVRAGDVFYPPHFPRRMEDSLGVDQLPATGSMFGRPEALAQAQIRDAQALRPPSSSGSAASPRPDTASNQGSTSRVVQSGSEGQAVEAVARGGSGMGDDGRGQEAEAEPESGGGKRKRSRSASPSLGIGSARTRAT